MDRAKKEWTGMRTLFAAALIVAAHICAGEAEPPKVEAKGTHDQPAPMKASASVGDLVKTGQFFFPRLQFQCNENVPDKWDIHLVGDQILRESVKKMTNINILADYVIVNLDRQEEMCEYPFVFMTSEGTFTLSEKNIQTLREYLLRGGFLYADDCVLNQTGDLFFKSFVENMKKVFPDNPMRPVPKDHEIYNCFFKLNGDPHVQGVDHPAMGLFDKKTGRLMCFATSGDVHCGWIGWGNLNQMKCRQCVQMGINIIVYSLTH
jgi:hypothetical protein